LTQRWSLSRNDEIFTEVTILNFMLTNRSDRTDTKCLCNCYTSNPPKIFWPFQSGYAKKRGNLNSSSPFFKGGWGGS
jgi:hypothetical protein